MTCNEYRERMSRDIDRLASDETNETRRHLTQCPECRRYFDEEVRMVALIAASVRPLRMREDLTGRIIDRLPEAEEMDDLPTPGSRILWWGASLAAAAAMLIIGLLSLPINETPPPSNGDERIQPAAMPPTPHALQENAPAKWEEPFIVVATVDEAFDFDGSLAITAGVDVRFTFMPTSAPIRGDAFPISSDVYILCHKALRHPNIGEKIQQARKLCASKGLLSFKKGEKVLLFISQSLRGNYVTSLDEVSRCLPWSEALEKEIREEVARQGERGKEGDIPRVPEERKSIKVGMFYSDAKAILDEVSAEEVQLDTMDADEKANCHAYELVDLTCLIVTVARTDNRISALALCADMDRPKSERTEKKVITVSPMPLTPDQRKALDKLNSWDKEELDIAERPAAYPNRKASGESNGWIHECKEALKNLGMTAHWYPQHRRYAARILNKPDLSTPEKAWAALQDALKSGEIDQVKIVSTEQGFQSLNVKTEEEITKLADFFKKRNIEWKKDADKATVEVGTKNDDTSPARGSRGGSLVFVKTSEGFWMLDEWFRDL